jgi:hypothetical protein
MISRRAVLKGALGGGVLSVGLPLFEQMLNSHGTALAAGAALPKRYGLFFWAHGLPLNYRHNATGTLDGNQYLDYKAANPDLWTPTTTGTDWQVTDLLTPLTRHKANINVVTGTDVKTVVPSTPPGQNDGHLRCAAVALTADRPSSDGYDQGISLARVNRPTLDQFIATHPQFYTDGRPRFKSLELGVSKTVFNKTGTYAAISQSGPDLLNMPIQDPKQLFDFVFAMPPDTGEVTRRVSVLDVVSEDSRLLMNKLGTRDRQRLDEHLSHIQDIEARLKSGQGGCAVPPQPAGTFTDDTQNMALLDALTDILVAALRCDLTRVFTLMFTKAGTIMMMNAAGVANGPGAIQTHEAAHFQSGAAQHDVIMAITRYHMTAFAKLLDKLSAETDVNGQTLLDSSCIFGTSELGEGFHHGGLEMPVVLAGKAGGNLETGWHVRDERGNFCRAHYTILRAMGINVTSYGFNGAETSQALPFLKV